MNQKQNELFQNVLDEVRGQLHDLLEGFIEYDYFESAQEMLDGIKHVGAIQANIDGAIKREDMKWVVDYMFGEDRDREDRYEATCEMFESVNATYELCTDSEVKELIDELFNM